MTVPTKSRTGLIKLLVQGSQITREGHRDVLEVAHLYGYVACGSCAGGSAGRQAAHIQPVPHLDDAPHQRLGKAHL